ncbi:hypothetical protein ACJJTC_007973 [Scirpophaga incertulas]
MSRGSSDEVSQNQDLPGPSLSRYLRPDKFKTEPTSERANLKWTHWRYTFGIFLSEEAPSAALRLIAQGCNFKNVTAREHEEETIRGVFIAGVSSSKIRERLLENKQLTLDKALDQALALETAEQSSKIIGESNALQGTRFVNYVQRLGIMRKSTVAVNIETVMQSLWKKLNPKVFLLQHQQVVVKRPYL